MNDFEIYLQEKTVALKAKRELEGNDELNEIELFKLVLMEVSYGELSTIKKIPHADIRPIIEKSIYIEARIRKYSPEDALVEMRKQMEERPK